MIDWLTSWFVSEPKEKDTPHDYPHMFPIEFSVYHGSKGSVLRKGVPNRVQWEGVVLKLQKNPKFFEGTGYFKTFKNRHAIDNQWFRGEYCFYHDKTTWSFNQLKGFEQVLRDAGLIEYGKPVWSPLKIKDETSEEGQEKVKQHKKKHDAALAAYERKLASGHVLRFVPRDGNDLPPEEFMARDEELKKLKKNVSLRDEGKKPQEDSDEEKETEDSGESSSKQSGPLPDWHPFNS